jgi:hypothetical protein
MKADGVFKALKSFLGPSAAFYYWNFEGLERLSSDLGGWENIEAPHGDLAEALS